jgi:hypothetical protein
MIYNDLVELIKGDQMKFTKSQINFLQDLVEHERESTEESKDFFSEGKYQSTIEEIDGILEILNNLAGE